jgi:hypothetical protein
MYFSHSLCLPNTKTTWIQLAKNDFPKTHVFAQRLSDSMFEAFIMTKIPLWVPNTIYTWIEVHVYWQILLDESVCRPSDLTACSGSLILTPSGETWMPRSAGSAGQNVPVEEVFAQCKPTITNTRHPLNCHPTRSQ